MRNRRAVSATERMREERKCERAEAYLHVNGEREEKPRVYLASV